MCNVRSEAAVSLLQVQIAEILAVPSCLLRLGRAVVVRVVEEGVEEGLRDVFPFGAEVVDQLVDCLQHAEHAGKVAHGDVTAVRRISRGRGPGAGEGVVERLAGDEAVLQLGVGFDGFDELAARVFPVRAPALPLDQVRLSEPRPVGAEVEVQRGRVGCIFDVRGAHFAARVDEDKCPRRLLSLADEIARALVATGDVEESLPVHGRGDAGLLCAVGPVLDSVARAEAGEVAQMVRVDFATVAGLVVGEAVGTRVAGAEEVAPEEEVGGEFGVVPSIASDIVPPLVAVVVVGVDDVAVVSEAVPATLFHLVLVEVDQELHVLLDRLRLR